MQPTSYNFLDKDPLSFSIHQYIKWQKSFSDIAQATKWGFQGSGSTCRFML